MVDEIIDEGAARAFGLEEGRLTAMIHTGSRGLGYQVCSEHVKELEGRYRHHGGVWESEDWGSPFLTHSWLPRRSSHGRESLTSKR